MTISYAVYGYFVSILNLLVTFVRDYEAYSSYIFNNMFSIMIEVVD
jgi:hypothetical protein